MKNHIEDEMMKNDKMRDLKVIIAFFVSVSPAYPGFIFIYSSC